MKVLGMSSGLNEFHDFANVNFGVRGLSLRERQKILAPGGRNCKMRFQAWSAGALACVLWCLHRSRGRLRSIKTYPVLRPPSKLNAATISAATSNKWIHPPAT